MKHEILKKTAIYRFSAFVVGFLVPLALTGNVAFSFGVGLITELLTLVNYYCFELVWRRFVNYWNLKKGMNLFIVSNGTDKHGWYNVVEVIDENKFVIEVV